MEIIRLEEPDEGWDKRLLEHNGSFYQTTGYAEYLKKSLGYKIIYLIIKDSDKILAQLTIHYGPRFLKYLKEKHQIISKLFSKLFNTYYFIHGPTIFIHHHENECYELFINYLEKDIKTKWFMAQDLTLPIKTDNQFYEFFDNHGFYRDSWGTIILDLSKSEEEIFNGISRDQRKKIKRAQEIGLIVKEAVTKEDYEKIISIIENMCTRNKIFEGTTDYYRTLFNVLSERNMIKSFFIEYNGNLISTISLYLFGKNSWRALPSHTDYSLTEKIPGMAFIEWHAIKWAKNNGYLTYDLTGIRPESTDPKEIGIKEYKMHWGGEVITYPYFSKVYSSFKGKVIDYIKRSYKDKKKDKQNKK